MSNSTRTQAPLTQTAPEYILKLRGASSGPRSAAFHRPTYADKTAEVRLRRDVNAHFQQKALKERLAAAFRIFAKLGYDEGVAGHISVRDNIRSE